VAVRPIVEYPDPRLRAVARPVEHFDEELRSLIGDLCDTLDSVGGLGLSAPQVGDDRAVFVARTGPGESELEAYVNPVLVGRSALGLVEESCLSIPGVVGNVIRPTEIRVRTWDGDGRECERALSAMAAVCVQHEMDHLEGTLFIDRLSILKRLRLRFAGLRTRRPARLRSA
jgi:peptide deformylase